MKNFARFALTTGAAALFAGCGGPQPPIGWPGAMPQSRAVVQHANRGRSWMLPKAKNKALLYVVNINVAYNDITIYHAKAKDPSPIGTINDGLFEPTADCVGRDGTLYVTNEPGSGLGWVSVYPAGQTRPSRMITYGINIPVFCALDAHGDLWVTNLGSGSVTEYKPGSSQPKRVITNGVPDPNGIAFDGSGNMYVSNDASDTDAVINVVVFAPGTNYPMETITDGVQSPVGIAVDSNSTLYVTNFVQNNIEKYHAGKRHPYEAITNGINEPNAVTVGKNGWLYVTDAGPPVPAIVEFSPGSLTPSIRKITKGLENPEGTAYFPPLQP